MEILKIWNKVLHDKGFNIAKNPKYDVYQCKLASVVDKCFDKKILEEPLHLQINLHWKMKIFLIKN